MSPSMTRLSNTSPMSSTQPSAAVKYRGKELHLPPTDVYFLLNKPAGCICSRLNSQELELNKTSVYELFRDAVEPSVYESLVTVGRLDEDTTGLLTGHH